MEGKRKGRIRKGEREMEEKNGKDEEEMKGVVRERKGLPAKL